MLNENLKDKKIQFMEEVTARYGVELKKQEDLLKESVETQLQDYRRLQQSSFLSQSPAQSGSQ
jgi:hypothetical protein